MFPFHSNFDTSPPHAAALARMPLYPRPAFGRGASAFGSETSAAPSSSTSSPTSRTTGVTSKTSSATSPSSTRALLAAAPPPAPPMSRVSSTVSPTLTKQKAPSWRENVSSDNKKQQHSIDTAEEDEDEQEAVDEATSVDDETAAHLREVNEAYFLAFEEASTESEEEKNTTRSRPVQSGGSKRQSLEAGKRAEPLSAAAAARSAALPANQSLAPPPPPPAQGRRAVSQQSEARRTSLTNDRNRGIDTNSSSVGSAAESGKNAKKAKNPKNNDSNVFRYSFGAPVEDGDGVIPATRQAPESMSRSTIRSVPFGAQVGSAESRKGHNDLETEDELEEEEGGGGWGEIIDKEKEEDTEKDGRDYNTEEEGEDNDAEEESEVQGARRHSGRRRDTDATSSFKAKTRGESGEQGHMNDNTDDEEGMNENIYHDHDHDDHDDSGVRISSSSPRSGAVEGVTRNKRVNADDDENYLYDDFGRKLSPAVVAAKRAEGKRKIAHEKRAAQAFKFSGGHESAIWLVVHTFSVFVNVSIFALAIAAALAPWVIITVASTTTDESLNIQYALLTTTTIRLDTIGATISTCENKNCVLQKRAERKAHFFLPSHYSPLHFFPLFPQLSHRPLRHHLNSLLPHFFSVLFLQLRVP